MGAASCMVLDAVSYLVSAVMLGALPRPDSRPTPKAPASFRTQLTDGFAYIGTRPVLRTALVIGTIGNLIGAALIAIAPLYIVRTLHEHAFVIGLIYASEGAGGLVGAALATRISHAWGSARVVLRCALPLPLVLVLLPLAFRGVGAVLFGLGIFGFAVILSFLGIALLTHRQRTVPADMLPRVLAITQVVSRGSSPFGALVAGGLATVFGVHAALFVIAAFGVGVPLSAWATPELRRRINLEDELAESVCATTPASVSAHVSRRPGRRPSFARNVGFGALGACPDEGSLSGTDRTDDAPLHHEYPGHGGAGLAEHREDARAPTMSSRRRGARPSTSVLKPPGAVAHLGEEQDATRFTRRSRFGCRTCIWTERAAVVDLDRLGLFVWLALGSRLPQISGLLG